MLWKNLHTLKIELAYEELAQFKYEGIHLYILVCVGNL